MPISPDIMARGVARDIQNMDANAIAALRPAMAAAQLELEHDLKKWMKLLGPNAAQLKYTPAHLRQVQLILGVAEGAASGNKRTGYPTIASRAVKSVVGLAEAPQKAAQTLKHELESLAGQFADIPPPQLVHAAALAAGKNLVLDRYPRSAARYAGQVKDDLKLQFGIGLAKGETIGQLTKRIANISTFKAAVDANHPEHAAKAMAAGLSRRYENWANRLVRTELVNSYNYTATQGIKKAHEMDDRVVMVWDAANDMRVCPACRDMHGRNIMPGAKGGFFSRMINRGVDYPPLHPYCFLPGTRIAGRATAVMRSQYDGQAVELTMQSGHRLRVTANHPVATPAGFVAASLIGKGSHVLGQGGDVWGPGVPTAIATIAGETHEDHVPPTIDEVFGAAAQTCPGFRTTTAQQDLHGDAASGDGYIDVVAIDGELWDGSWNSSTQLGFPQALVQQPIHSGARLGNLDGGCIYAATSRFMCGSYLPSTLFGAHASPLDRLGLGLPAQGNSHELEPTIESSTADSTIIADLFHRFPGDVTLDEVIDVRQFHWSGHVYDLSTSTGWLVAQGTYVSNCRCAVVAWMAEWGTEDVEEPDLIAPVPGQVEFDPDTFDPPAPPAQAPTPVSPLTPLVPELAEGLMAAIGEGDEDEVLENIGKTITDSLNSMGLHKRDHGYDKLTVGQPGVGADACREWNGKITMLKEVHRGMVDFLEYFKTDAVARKLEMETISAKDLYAMDKPFIMQMGDGVRVAVHEHIHGYGPVQKEHYHGHGLIVEEVSTEVAARRITRDQFGLDLRTRHTSEGGSYRDYIHGMLDVIQKSVPNTTLTGAWGILEDASLKFKSDPPLSAWLDPVRGWHETVAAVANPDNSRLRSRLSKAFEAKFPIKK